MWNTLRSSGNSCNATYEVKEGGINEYSTNVDQGNTANLHKWISLGTYDFAAGTSKTVRISSNCGGSRTTADAIKFEYRGESGGASVKLQYNATDTLSNYNSSRSRIAIFNEGGTAWNFLNGTRFTGGGSTFTADSTGISSFPYFAIGSFGQNFWTGAFDSTWNDGRNWQLYVPTKDDDVIIPSSVASGRAPKSNHRHGHRSEKS